MPFTMLIPVNIWIAMITLSWKNMDIWFMWYFPWLFGLNTLVGLMVDV